MVVDVPFGVSDNPQITEPQWETTKPKKFSIPKFCLYSPSDAEKFADFDGTIIFEI